MHVNLLKARNRCWRSLFWESETSSLLVAELLASADPHSQGPVQVARFQSFVWVASFLQGPPFPQNTLSPNNYCLEGEKAGWKFQLIINADMYTYTYLGEVYVMKGTGYVSGETWAENPGFPFTVNATVCETFSLAKLQYSDPK